MNESLGESWGWWNGILHSTS